MPNPTPPDRSPKRSMGEADAAEITARILLETESVLFRPEDPFTFTSGLRSPVYIDCRRLISFPRVRHQTRPRDCCIRRPTNFGRNRGKQPVS